MISNKRVVRLVDPAEVVELYRHFGTGFEVSMAFAVAKEYQKRVNPLYRE